MKLEPWQLKQKQSLPLEVKIQLSFLKIRQFLQAVNQQAYISVSGGLDSRALQHMCLMENRKLSSLFIDTGLEYPSVRDMGCDIATCVLRPKMSFADTIDHYGFPVVSKEVAQWINEARTTNSLKLYTKRMKQIPDKWLFLMDAPFKISHQCCNVMKKRPAKYYETRTGKAAIVGTMASDSRLRKTNYLKHGCNSFEGRVISAPMGFWLKEDVWGYVNTNSLSYPSIYDEGINRTGCVFCMFGVHMEKEPNRFQILKRTHPKLWLYCMDKLGIRDVMSYLNLPIE